MVGFRSELSSWFTDGHLLTFLPSSCGCERICLMSSSKGIHPIHESSTSPGPHLQMPSSWRSVLQHMNAGGMYTFRAWQAPRKGWRNSFLKALCETLRSKSWLNAQFPYSWKRRRGRQGVPVEIRCHLCS